MTISVLDAGKRFNRDWIFRKVNLELRSGQHYAITGHNGSGKSTLLQCIAGSIHLSEGSILFKQDDQWIEEEKKFNKIALCAPYLEIIEEMTALEFLDYHAQFKPFQEGWKSERILTEIGLGGAANKQIRYFSSGMKQRVKLAQAFFSDTPILLLDEPCTNLDQQGIELYERLINTLCKERIVVISSNDKTEYASCNDFIRMDV